MDPRRPPPLVLDAAEGCRRDVDSDDVRRVYPELPRTAHARNALLRARDLAAYRAIAHDFPDFTPPSSDSSSGASPPIAGGPLRRSRRRRS